MNSLLGVHVKSLVTGLPELLETWKPPVVVSLVADPFWTRLKSISPGTMLVYRDPETDSLPAPWEGGSQEDLAALALARLERAARSASGISFDYLQLTNNPVIADRDSLARFAAFEVEAIEAAAARGIKLAIGTFAMGSPRSLGWWDAYYPALRSGRTHGACLLLHEYNYPSLQTRDAIWYNLRHRKVYQRLPEELRIPVIIGECGLNGAARGLSGSWKGKISEDEYASQLELYDAELLRDPNVLGAAVYCVSPADEMAEFNVWPEPATALALSASPLYRGYTLPTYRLGVDVSWWQGPSVDWIAVARSGISFAIVRASRGIVADAIYLRNCRAMPSSIQRSAYHYVSTEDNPAEQAQVCARQIRQFPLPTWADLEDKGLTDEACRIFVKGLEQALGASVGIYTSRYKASQIKLGNWAAEHPLWVADWRGKDTPLIPAPWEAAGKPYTYWQFKVAPSWPGFPGRVDLNRMVVR